MADKEAKKLSELQFAGQDTDEAKSAVKRQRELKKKKDALRKAEKKLKAAKPEDADHAALVQDLEEIKAAVAELEGVPVAPAGQGHNSGSASPSPRDPVGAPTSSPGTEAARKSQVAEDAAQHTKADEKEAKRQAELQFAGQNSDEAREAVKRQRELKKKRDALRKTQKKLKSMKPEDAAYTATKEEEALLEQEINELGGDVDDASPSPSPLHQQEQGKVAPAGASEAKKPAEAAKESEKEKEDVEANAALLRQMVERAMRDSRGVLATRLRDSLVHPRVAEVTVMMEDMLIVGGNARALAMIVAFREMFETTTILAGSSLQDIDTQAFTELVERNFAFMRRKREANTGMRYVKEAVVRRLVALRDEIVQHRHRGGSTNGSGSGAGDSRSPSAVLDSFTGDARDVALQILDMVEAEIRMSVTSIVEERSLPYVSSSDTILVFGRSSVVEFLLLSRVRSPHRKPKKVIVVDSAPLFEGRELAHKLSEVGIDVTYGLITATCTLMPKCTRVFIGASSVLQNGDVFGRCGTALIAACAKTFRKPVLCFAESYKFVSEVWLGNLAQNTKLMDIRESPLPHETVGRSPLAYSTPPSLSSPQPPQLGCGAGSVGAGSNGTWWGRGGGEYTPPHISGGVATNSMATPVLLFPADAVSPVSAAASGYLYDLTPAANVDMIICEMGCLHTSAIIAAIKDREGRDASPAMYLNSKSSM